MTSQPHSDPSSSSISCDLVSLPQLEVYGQVQPSRSRGVFANEEKNFLNRRESADAVKKVELSGHDQGQGPQAQESQTQEPQAKETDLTPSHRDDPLWDNSDQTSWPLCPTEIPVLWR
jgi:hypothetical protein